MPSAFNICVHNAIFIQQQTIPGVHLFIHGLGNMIGISLLANFALILAIVSAHQKEIEEDLPTKCHVCKHMTRELSEELGRSDKSNDVLYMGQLFQKEPKKIPYRQSELRLTEALENACSNVLEYKVHKDKPLSLRYEKVESTTFKTLKELKNRGVKVDLGFPDQMWDTPDVEVTRLKSRCEHMVEMYEDEISKWYLKLPDTNLTQWLCVERVLKPSELDCLNETQDDGNEKEERKRKKTDSKKENKVNKILNKKKMKTRNKKNDQKQDNRKDMENIQKLIREQAEEQSRSRSSGDRFRQHDDHSRLMSESKRKELRERLRAINDPDRLRREIRRIRTKELTGEEYSLKDPLESGLDSDILVDLQRDNQRNQQFEAVEDFQREIETRVLEIEKKNDVIESTVIRKMLQRYIEDSKQIRDKRELQKRLEDLNAFTAILTDQAVHDEL